MTEKARSPRELDEPDALRSAAATSGELIFELETASPSEAPLFVLGPAHQLLCELRPSRNVVVSLPNHDSVTPTST